jgi:hypothetical protein
MRFCVLSGFLEKMDSDSHCRSVKKYSYYEALGVSEMKRLAVEKSAGWKTGLTKKGYCYE